MRGVQSFNEPLSKEDLTSCPVSLSFAHPCLRQGQMSRVQQCKVYEDELPTVIIKQIR